MLKVGRIAGQFVKPRSSPFERTPDGEIPVFRGHMIHDDAPTAAARAPDPDRMIEGYHLSAATLNLVRAFTKGGFADLSQVHLWNQAFVASSPQGQRYEALASEIERALAFMAACGIDLAATPQLHQVDVWTSHEGLLLDYEEGLTRRDSFTGDWYDCSAHMLWIGDRTRQLDGAHVQFFAGVHNPLGCKLGPEATPDEVVELCERLNPGRIPGRLTLIARLGAERVVELLPPLLRAVREAGHPVVWVCDPMHANVFVASGGRKTRHFDAIMAEIEGFFAACRAEQAWPGGVHLEYTGEDVTECLGGSEDIAEDQLDHRYETLCDPRLNGRQSLDLAFRLAELMRRAPRRLSEQCRLRRLTIVGTGLIGASLGLAARAKGTHVAGWDPDPEALAVAAARGAVEATGSLEEALAGAELAVVAAPIAALPAQVAAVLAATGEGTTVTDVGSTKVSVVEAAGGSPRFVGGHPIAGSEAHGAESASAGLFESATWFLTPTAQTDAERHRLVHGFVAELGAFPVAIDPVAHDRLVALTSHLPHVLANVIVNRAGASRVEGHDPLANAGGSLRDMTRIAGANPRMWIDIFLDNADAVREELADFRRRIEQVEAALEQGDAGFLARWIGEAAQNRRRMLEGAYADAGRALPCQRARAGPAGSVRGHHAGTRRGADQHRGLRARAHLTRARGHRHAARHRRGRGAPRCGAARKPGLRRRRLGGAR